MTGKRRSIDGMTGSRMPGIREDWIIHIDRDVENVYTSTALWDEVVDFVAEWLAAYGETGDNPIARKWREEMGPERTRPLSVQR